MTNRLSLENLRLSLQQVLDPLPEDPRLRELLAGRDLADLTALWELQQSIADPDLSHGLANWLTELQDSHQQVGQAHRLLSTAETDPGKLLELVEQELAGLSPAPDQPEVPSYPQEPSKVSRANWSRLLVVEDAPSLREKLRSLVEQQNQGCDVRCAGSLEEALVQLDEWRPGLVLLDLDLPRRDEGPSSPEHGLELLEELSRAELPVVLLTAYAGRPELLERALAHPLVDLHFKTQDFWERLPQALESAGPAPAHPSTLEVDGALVLVNGHQVELSPASRKLLEVLKAGRQFVSTEALGRDLALDPMDPSAELSVAGVQSRVSRLRRELNGEYFRRTGRPGMGEALIQTKPAGYCLNLSSRRPVVNPAPGPWEVLVVEDEASMRARVCHALSMFRRELAVREAASPEEARAALRAGRPLGVILDLGLPAPEQGLGLLRELQQQALPVLVFSGHEENAWRAATYRHGVKGFDYVRKGQDGLPALLARVYRWLQQARLGVTLVCEGPVHSLRIQGKTLVIDESCSVKLTYGEFRLLGWLARHPLQGISEERFEEVPADSRLQTEVRQRVLQQFPQGCTVNGKRLEWTADQPRGPATNELRKAGYQGRNFVLLKDGRASLSLSAREAELLAGDGKCPDLHNLWFRLRKKLLKIEPTLASACVSQAGCYQLKVVWF